MSNNKQQIIQSINRQVKSNKADYELDEAKDGIDHKGFHAAYKRVENINREKFKPYFAANEHLGEYEKSGDKKHLHAAHKEMKKIIDSGHMNNTSWYLHANIQHHLGNHEERDKALQIFHGNYHKRV